METEMRDLDRFITMDRSEQEDEHEIIFILLVFRDPSNFLFDFKGNISELFYFRQKQWEKRPPQLLRTR